MFCKFSILLSDLYRSLSFLNYRPHKERFCSGSVRRLKRPLFFSKTSRRCTFVLQSTLFGKAADLPQPSGTHFTKNTFRYSSHTPFYFFSIISRVKNGLFSRRSLQCFRRKLGKDDSSPRPQRRPLAMPLQTPWQRLFRQTLSEA